MGTKAVLHSTASPLMRRAAAHLGTALLLCFVATGAHAQSCTPATPRTDSGTGFVPFGTYERTLARGGNSGPACLVIIYTSSSETSERTARKFG